MSDDLLREASKRLGIVSLLGAALWIIAPTLGHLAATGPRVGVWVDFGALDVAAAISVILSLGLYAYTRRTDTDPGFVLNLALAYMISIALALSIAFHWGSVPANTSVRPMISWVGAVVLVFAALVPSRPGRILAASLLAASMGPVSMLIARARGAWDFGSPVNALVMHYPDFLLAGVAVVISYVVTRLGQQVTRAREMGSYRLGELLGRGGMGVVYKATHRMLARPAAIKLIRPEVLAGSDGDSADLAITRFRREAQAAASLTSPHTVQVFDFGVTEDSALYFVMELLEGMDLESLVRQYGPLPPARVVHILRQVCESLEEAHSRSLIHRDVKPENIHLGRVGLRYDFVKVLDFGLVKALGSKKETPTLSTSEGLTPGTPAYMAPEVALGEAVDHRADIYALGCVAYYLLTAELVFTAETTLQLVAMHLQSEPVAPSRRTSHEVPAALDQLILACLAKAPRARPQSAAAVGTALSQVSVPLWTEEHAQQWWSANRPNTVHASAVAT